MYIKATWYFFLDFRHDTSTFAYQLRKMNCLKTNNLQNEEGTDGNNQQNYSEESRHSCQRANICINEKDDYLSYLWVCMCVIVIYLYLK